MNIHLTDVMRADYTRLFNSCEINPDVQAEVDHLANEIAQNQDRYESVGSPLNIPWFFVGVTHCMESSLNFNRHLHNGDPLTARTVHVPKGRPVSGNPTFTWEESATDSLTFQGLDKVTDWSLPGILYQMEKYNGFGYRTIRPEVLTPYLWSFSNNYTSGKYVADGKFDPNAKSKQCGAAVLLRRLSETGTISFDADGNPVAPAPAAVPTGGTISPTPESFTPMVTYSNTQRSDVAMTLQRALNQMPGIFLRVDGIPGNSTSDAFHKVTGHFLTGDPRAS